MLRLLTDYCDRQFFRRHGATCVAIDAHNIHLLQLRYDQTSKRKLSFKFSEMAHEQNIERVLGELLRQHSCSKQACYFTLDAPYSKVLMLDVESLPANKKACDQFIRWRLEKELRKSLSDKAISYAVADHLEKTQGTHVNVVTCDRSLVKLCKSVATDHEMSLEAIHASSLCLSSVVARLNASKDSSMLLSINPHSWNITVFGAQNSCYYHRSRPWLNDRSCALQSDRLIKDMINVWSYFNEIGVLTQKTISLFGDHVIVQDVKTGLKAQGFTAKNINTADLFGSWIDDSLRMSSDILSPLSAFLIEHQEVEN